MNKKNRYIPDTLVTPGDVVEDYLESYAMTQVELANRTGLSKKAINEIIKGKAPITSTTALKFERTLGRPAHFWNNLERQYQENLERITERKTLEKNLEWLKAMPTNEMIKLGWIKKHTDKLQQLEELLIFFRIASPQQWKTVYNNHQVAFRRSKKIKNSKELLSAWLRQGEILAQQISCATYDKKLFSDTLTTIRELSNESPKVFVPKLINLCADAGVAVVFVPELPKLGIYGATRWIRNKPVIQLSLRYKSNDHLWFTFFHEVAHILKHGKKDVFLEGDKSQCQKEKEANEFANNILIPADKWQCFINKKDFKLASIKRFANDINIAPGIIVGRLQYEGYLKRNVGNHLKIFYEWKKR